jgi:hypothetical protein
MAGVEDVVLGLPVAGRTTRAAMTTPAMLANELPLRLTVRPSRTVAELLQQVSELVSQLLRLKRYPLDELHHDLGLAGTGAGLFGRRQHPVHREELRFGSATGQGPPALTGRVTDLTISVVGSPQGPTGIQMTSGSPTSSGRSRRARIAARPSTRRGR